MKKIIFIAWNKFHRRNDVISKMLDIKSYHIGENKKNMLLSAISFIPKSFKTIKILKQENPDVVIVTNNAWVLPALVYIWCKHNNKKIILDTHSCGVSGHWLAYPLLLRKYISRNANVSLVTNTNHSEILKSWGAKSIVLPDPPIIVENELNNKHDHSSEIWVTYINTYAFDEPYTEVIEAVDGINSIKLFITGNYSNVEIRTDKNNIVHTGYLSQSDYEDLLVNSDIILVLTYREDTFQCGANEGLSFEKVMVLSNSKYLKSYYGNSAVFVDPKDSKSIKNGIKTAIENNELLITRIKKVKEDKINSSKVKIDELMREINKW